MPRGFFVRVNGDSNLNKTDPNIENYENAFYCLLELCWFFYLRRC